MTRSYQMRIKNYLTVEEIVVPLTPGPHGFVGKNAVGKTNILQAIQDIRSGKHDLRKIRDGADKSLIQLEVVENDEIVASVSRKQTQVHSYLQSKGLPKDETSKSFLSKLIDKEVINPIQLVTTDPVGYLKKYLPVSLKEEDIKEHPKAPKVNLEENGFEECEKQAAFFEQIRLVTGQQAREMEAVIKDMYSVLGDEPEVPEEGKEELEAQKVNYLVEKKNRQAWRERRAELNARLSAKKSALASAQASVANEKTAREEIDAVIETEAPKSLAEKKQLLQETHEQQIKVAAETRGAVSVTATNLVERAKEALREAERKSEEMIHQAECAYSETHQRLAVKLQTEMEKADAETKSTIENCMARRDASLKDEQLYVQNEAAVQEDIALIDKELSSIGEVAASDDDCSLKVMEIDQKLKLFDVQATYLEKKSRITEKEAECKVLRDKYDYEDVLFKHYNYVMVKTLIDRCELPVKGIEFRESELYVDGRHIERLSTAERALVATKLAISLAQQQGHIVICLDGIEFFDEEHRQAFIDATKEADICVLYSRYDEGVEAVDLPEHETLIEKEIASVEETPQQVDQ